MSDAPGKRFERLEIGLVGAAPAPPPAGETRSCHHCGQPNPAASASCWACQKPVAPPPAAPAPAPEPKVLAEGREPRIVVRIDGKTYTSGDADLPERPREVIDQVRLRGVTPELMDDLRRGGGDARYRPSRSHYPSDGDYDFWGGPSGRYGFRYPYAWASQFGVPWYWMLVILGGAVLGAWLTFGSAYKRLLDQMIGG